MVDLSILLGEDVRWIQFASYVIDCDYFCLYIFSDCIFTYLNITESFCCHVVRPLNSYRVVVVNLEQLLIDNGVVNIEILGHIDNVL